ncbi:hypothetical protein CSC2_38210 [Clostridium zeae]|uniref:Uncharacterized protein n=1 Tax=Clostridium zeae TaxID=2759022 RepID=A0ABQ1EEQ6_9CLOT|nr:hypothetical protein CSC2_38210 [Clostridium zeae]
MNIGWLLCFKVKKYKILKSFLRFAKYQHRCKIIGYNVGSFIDKAMYLNLININKIFGGVR